MNPADECIEMLHKLERAVEKLSGIINGTLSKIPGFLGWIVDKVIDGWNALVAKLQEFWDWFLDKLAYVGNPFALNDASVSWKVDVGAVAANVNRQIDDHDLLVDDNWKGKGADQYRQSVPDQRDAFKSLNADYAQNIGNALETMRNAILVFWGAVVIAIISILVAFGLATGEAVTIFGIPLAPPTALAGIAVALSALAAALIAFAVQKSLATSSIATARAGVNPWPDFTTA